MLSATGMGVGDFGIDLDAFAQRIAQARSKIGAHCRTRFEEQGLGGFVIVGFDGGGRVNGCIAQDFDLCADAGTDKFVREIFRCAV